MAAVSNFVIDASAVLAFLLPDEANERLTLFFKNYSAGKIRLFSTNLLTWEVFNGLRSAIISHRLDQRLAARLAKAFLSLEIEVREVDYLKTLKVALNHQLSFYDAGYYYLSCSLRAPLISLDRNLQKLSSGSSEFN